MKNLQIWLQRRADDVAVLMLSALFLTFVVQITARYVFNYPLGWTLELCLILWLWTVFWGSSFCLRHDEHVRFDMIYLIVSSGTRRKLAAISALAIIVTMLVAFPRTYDFVSFLQIKKSGTLRIPLAYIFSIYLVFMLSSIAIYGRGLLRLWRGQELSDSGAAGGIV